MLRKKKLVKRFKCRPSSLMDKYNKHLCSLQILQSSRDLTRNKEKINKRNKHFLSLSEGINRSGLSPNPVLQGRAQPGFPSNQNALTNGRT